MLRFESASFSYEPTARPNAIEGVSFDLGQGEMVAVVGANGSGKSTLVRLSNGLLLPDGGRVTVDGADTADPSRRREVRAAVGVVFQRPDDQIVATSVEDEIAFGPENLGLPRDEIRRRVDHAISAVGLCGLERREPHLLSGGQKQRLAIAGVLAMGSRYVVLDEPTSMIDPHGRAEVLHVMNELRRGGHGVLNVTHDLGEAMNADRVIVLAAGEVVFRGSPGELVGQSTAMQPWGLRPTALMTLNKALEDAGRVVPGLRASVEELAAALWP